MDDDDDFALVDSFINFDYAAAYSPTTSHLPTHLDLTIRNFGDIVVNDGEIRGESEIIIDDVNEISEIVIDNDDNAGEITIEIMANDGEIRGQTEIIINGDDISEIEIENDDDIYEIEIENIDDIDEIEIESTTESESSSSSSESEDYELEEGEIVDSDVDDSEDGSEEITSWGIHDADDNQFEGRSDRSRNDLENLPRVPPVNVNLGPHHKMLPVGVVTSIVGVKVIVEGVEKHAPLNEGSILWITERQTPLGLIDEIFGQVTSPYYVVRYNSKNEVPEGIHEGTLVSFIAEFVNHVLDDKDLYEKGYDEEMSDELEFSDDEKEAEYKRRQKQNKRGPNNRNPKTMENNRKKVPPNNVSIPTVPVAPAAPLVAHGHCRPPMPGTRQDFFGAAYGHSSSLPVTGQGFSGTPNLNPPFPPVNGGLNLFPTGVLTNGAPLPPQQPAEPANEFPTNGVL
ncbi:hypothetical protein P8452_57709 [Trifolium repens]|nr:hypothetical protein P8452_57709 [Trifolium repens]